MSLAGHARDHWRRLRNSLLASPRFQKFAVSFPLFRQVSRARSRQLFDILAGFAYSQVLYSCVRLGLIELLRGRPLAIPEIAARIGWNAGRTATLLKAAAALDILEATSTGTYTLGIHGAALDGNPWIAKFIEHHHLLYRDLADPLPLLRGEIQETSLKAFWGYAGGEGGDAANAASYTALMAASQEAVAAEILAAYDFRSHRHLIDVGGSNGTFIAAAAARHPHLAFTLFDLPPVAAIARDRIAAAGLAGRVAIAGGSFLTDPIPRCADIAMLIRIAHDHDDDSLLKAMRAIREALPENGRLLIAEPLSGNASTAPVTDAYFGLYFTAMGQGRTRTFTELSEFGRRAGFPKARKIRTRMPLITGIVQLDAS